MMDLDKIERDLMREVSGVTGIPEGAYNFRVNGKSIGRHSSEKIDIVPKKKKSGIDTKTILKIMAILAPLLMSKMGSSAESKAKKNDASDMMKVVSGMLDGVDAGDVIRLAGLLLK